MFLSVSFCFVVHGVGEGIVEFGVSFLHVAIVIVQGFVLGDFIALFSRARQNAFARIVTHW